MSNYSIDVLSNILSHLEMSASKEQSNLQKRVSLLNNVKTDLAPFTGLPSNSLNAAQLTKWSTMIDSHHGRLWRMFFKASTRNDAEEIQDALDSLTKYYQVCISFHFMVGVQR